MERKKWKAILRKKIGKDKAVSFLVMIGLCGVGLICLSSFSGKEKKTQDDPLTTAASVSEEEYEEKLEQGLVRVVRAITGEEEPTVLVTLEGGREYVYATDENTSSRQKEEESDGEREAVHVILKDSDGTQHGLTVTEIQPKVKGVVIVSRYAGDPTIRERLTEAVKTALGVSSARVCVTETG